MWSMTNDDKDIATAKKFHDQTGTVLITCHFCVHEITTGKNELVHNTLRNLDKITTTRNTGWQS